jgi:hypothetical protein
MLDLIYYSFIVKYINVYCNVHDLLLRRSGTERTKWGHIEHATNDHGQKRTNCFISQSRNYSNSNFEDKHRDIEFGSNATSIFPEARLIYTKCIMGASFMRGGASTTHDSLVANAKIKLVLSESSQYSERENRIHHQYQLP